MHQQLNPLQGVAADLFRESQDADRWRTASTTYVSWSDVSPCLCGLELVKYNSQTTP